MSITDKDFTELSVKVEKIGSKADSNGHRINDLESDVREIKDIQITLVKMANGIENMGNQIFAVNTQLKEVKQGQEKLSEKVNEIENRPANQTKSFVDKLKDKALLIVGGTLILYILATLFPMIPWR